MNTEIREKNKSCVWLMETSVEGTSALNRGEYDRQQDELTPCYTFQKET